MKQKNKDKNDDKIIFEDYGIEFTDEDFRGVEPDVLIACKKKLMKLLKEIQCK